MTIPFKFGLELSYTYSELLDFSLGLSAYRNIAEQIEVDMPICGWQCTKLSSPITALAASKLTILAWLMVITFNTVETAPVTCTSNLAAFWPDDWGFGRFIARC